jgi:hypothetical protein
VLICLCLYVCLCLSDRLGEAVDTLDEISESSERDFASPSSAYVADYGDRLVFSQKFTHDVSATSGGLPFMDAEGSDEAAAAAFLRFVGDKKSNLVNKFRSKVLR